MTDWHRAITLVALLMASHLAYGQGLLAVMEKALEADPRIDIADYQLRISENRRSQAFGGLLPQVSASANLSANETSSQNSFGITTDDAYGGERYNFTIQQSLYNKSALNSVSQSKRVVEQREFERESVVSQVLLEVAERYVNVLAASDDLDLARAEEAALRRQLDQTETLFDRQLVKVTDLLEVTTRYDSSQARRIEAANSLEVARQALTELINAPAERLLPLRDDLEFEAVEGELDDWLLKAERNNRQLLALQEAIAASNYGVEAARGRYFPTLDLTVNARQSNTGFDNAQTPETDSTYVALNVNVPLFAGGATKARVEEARNQRALAQLDYEQAKRQFNNAVQESWLGTRSTLRRIEANQRSAESAAKSVEAMRTTFQYGNVTAIDVVNAVQNEFRVRRELLQARYDHLVYRLRLLYFAGELDTEQMAAVDSWLSRVAHTTDSTDS